MSDMHTSTAIMREEYAASGAIIRLFPDSSNDERAAFRVDLPHGERWIVHAQRGDVPVPTWLDGCGTRDTFTFFHSRAQTLAYLEQQDYPAPRVVCTHGGALVGQAHGWVTLAATFVPGDVTHPTVEQLRLMSAALGKLHNVPTSHDAVIGTSWWYPERIIGSALEQLASVSELVPTAWHGLHHAMRTTLEMAQTWTHLPRAIIHGDAWAGNGVQTAPDQVVLIDWDPSGIGWPILALARLLIQSPVDLASPMDIVLQADPQRINAIVDGYCTQRIPSAAELDVLPEAIRFTVVAGGAWHFVRGPHQGWDRVASILARRQHRYHVSDEFARLAQECIVHHT